MPRVSDEHLAARRRQIIEAARVCFLRHGFHQTSMQDVIREAGLSVGAVYRYFPSKNELIAALAEQVVDQLALVFHGVDLDAPPKPLIEVLDAAIDFATANSGPDGALRLALQVWSESLHDPALAGFVDGIYRRLRHIVVAVTQRAQQRGELPASVDAEALGSVLFTLVPGYGLQRVLTGEPDPERFKAGVRALLATEIARAAG